MTDFALREGGLGRGLDRREDANKSESVGRFLRSGVVRSIGTPLAFPSSLWCWLRLWGEDVPDVRIRCIGVDGGCGGLEMRPRSEAGGSSVLGRFAARGLVWARGSDFDPKPSSGGGVNG